MESYDVKRKHFTRRTEIVGEKLNTQSIVITSTMIVILIDCSFTSIF